MGPQFFHFLKVLGAFAIGFFFLVMVMIATAQQDVLSRMKAEDLSGGYSYTLKLTDNVKKKSDELPQLRVDQHQAKFAVDRAQAAFNEASNGYEMGWEEFEPTLRKLAKAGLCGLSVPPDTDAPRTRGVLAIQVVQCEAQQPTPAGSRLVDAAKPQAGTYLNTVKLYLVRTEQLNTAKSELALVGDKIKASETLTPDEEKAVRSFGDMEVLLQPWVLFGDFLVRFPPPLFQVLLTFVSGLFGALLVTLVLVVYPQTQIVAPSAARPVARTFLGGLIALCVYIILLSGTAVLGSAGSNVGAGTNYMAFCGIGILAGMFSDRVAGWLSDRANVFFTTRGRPS